MAYRQVGGHIAEARQTMAEKEQPAPHQVGLLQKGLRVIETLIAAQQPLSLTGISEETGIDTSSAHRIMKILTTGGYALRDPRSKRYLPGPRAMYPLGLYHPLNVARRDALPLLRELCDETGQTVAMLVFLYGERIALEVLLGIERLTPFYETHVRRPLHSAASGKLLLATYSAEQRAALLGPPPYPSFTPFTITDTDTLDACLKEATRNGFATAADEAFIGLSAVAAPITTANGSTVGCFTIFGSSKNVTRERIPDYGEKLVRAAQLFTYMSPALETLEIIAGGGNESRRISR